ncbi:MAG: glycosyltransferase family 2 protein [Verrucomicrobiota bacterium]|nr:glycosyltransferase family 2 protein [Verrucomicrobiota bacterium]
MRVAVFTSVYNEVFWLPIWIRHYSAQVGAENCYVLDDGSDDGSTDNLPVNVERVRRAEIFDEFERLGRVQDRVAKLLRRYGAVLHTDCDELILADPARYSNLVAYTAATTHEVVTTAGLELVHLLSTELALDPSRPIGEQRRWVRFHGAMCKPALVRKPVTWQPGFHFCDAPTVFDGLYLVHLRWCDSALAQARLARTRAIAYSPPQWGTHWRWGDEQLRNAMADIATFPPEPFLLDDHAPPLEPLLEEVKNGRAVGDHKLRVSPRKLWELPERVRAIL